MFRRTEHCLALVLATATSLACGGGNATAPAPLAVNDGPPVETDEALAAAIAPPTERALGQLRALVGLGHSTYYAVHEDGRLFGWGRAGWALLRERGDIDHAEPVPGMREVVTLVAGHAEVCALSPSGAVRCWHNEDSPAPRVVARDAADLHESNGVSCLRSRAGAVRCWERGQEPADLPLGRPVEVLSVSERGQMCGIVDGGTVRCWHRLNVAEVPPYLVEGLAEVTSVAVSGELACAVHGEERALSCWLLQQAVPMPVSAVRVPTIEGVLELFAGPSHVCVRQADGRLACVADAHCPLDGVATSEGPPGLRLTAAAVDGMGPAARLLSPWCATRADGGLSCWNKPDDAPRCGFSASTIPGVTQAVAGSPSVDRGCVLTASGHVTCWGSNRSGQLGRSSDVYVASPVQARIDHVEELAVAGNHACARKSDGTAWCWGSGRHGLLGDGTTENRTEPVQVAGLSSVTAIATSAEMACARAAEGVHCWGQVGLSGDALTPREIRTRGSGRLLVGGRTLCSGDEGRLRCRSPYTNVRGPIADAAVAQSRLCVRLRGQASLQCRWWQFMGDSSRLAVLPGLVGVVDFDMTSNRGCAARQDGTVACWSWPDHGTPAADLAAVPGVHGATAVSLQQYRACALVAGGRVQCWGRRPYGPQASLPVEPALIEGLPPVEHVGLGNGFACARTLGGDVFCWGDRGNGNLGDAVGPSTGPGWVQTG